MSRDWWLKFSFLVAVCIGSALLVYPTVGKVDLEKTKLPFKQKINLGLDLQGGVYMVLGVDFNRVFRDNVDRQAAGIEQAGKDKADLGIKSVKAIREGLAADDPHLVVEFDPAQTQKISDWLKNDYSWTLRRVAESSGKIELGISSQFREKIRSDTITQSIEVVRNRIDEFGVTEPVITSQGADRLVVELPGVKDVERAKELIGRTASLEFKMLAETVMTEPQVIQMVEEVKRSQNLEFKEGDKLSAYTAKINEAVKSKIPENTEIVFGREEVMPGADPRSGRLTPYLLYRKADVTGQELQDASVGFNPDDNRPEVDFTLNPRGAVLFEKMSGENIGKSMAIVLDNIVHSVPRFQTKIPNGRVRITLGGNRSYDQVQKEANDLAIVLRAGALPAQLDFLEQRVIGPSLGADSIKKGAMASMIGTLLVFLFVLFYYRLSGAIAVVSLILNVLFVLALLVSLEATLTLPGIAGIALTVGIAVDSNVVIYERIREELRAGKRPGGAVEAGFQKAFRTILDANITNAAASIVLMVYGTGPIKGFAVTLLIGIVTTLFTAVFVCRLMFDAYLKRLEARNAATLSI